jgi:hypothetical protein
VYTLAGVPAGVTGAGDIMVGGNFPYAGSTSATNTPSFARFRPSSGAWLSPAGGINTAVPTTVRAMMLIPESVIAGGSIVVAGSFSGVGGGAGGTLAAANIARYNAQSNTWQALGAGTNGTVRALALAPDGTVYVAGDFTQAGGIGGVNGIAKVNPVTGAWSSVGGTGPGGTVNAVTTVGGGDPVIAGNFSAVGGVTANDIARFFSGSSSIPAITAQPVSRVACATGGPVTFSVGASGSGLAYRWRFNGMLIDPALNPSAATATLTLSGNLSAAAGQYSCDVLTAASCGVPSSPATLTVISGAPTVTTQPLARTVCIGGATTLTTNAATIGGVPATYRWKRTNPDRYIDPATNPSAATATLTIASAQLSDDGFYYCEATNACGTLSTSTARVTVNTPATITQQPVAVAGCTGGTATFTVAATGTGLSYRWQRNGFDIDLATTPSAATPTLTISSVGAGTVGSYRCVVSGTCGAVISNSVSLTQNSTAFANNPVGFVACLGGTASFSVNVAGPGPISYQWRLNGNPINTTANPSAATANLVVANVQNSDVGAYSCTATGACGPATSNAANLTLRTPATITITAQPVSVTVCTSQSTALTLTATASEAVSYQWRRNGVLIGSPSGGASLPLSNPQPADSGTYECVITPLICGTPVVSNPVTLTVNGSPTITSQPTSASTCIGGTASFTVAATPVGSGPLTYQWQRSATGTPIDPATNPSAATPTLVLTNVQLSDGGGYSCIVRGQCSIRTATTPAVQLTVSEPVAITFQPTPATVCSGTTVNMQITATGSGTLTYQWRKNGMPISPATNASAATNRLTLASTQSGDTGSYDCLVTGTCGGVATNAAQVTVNTTPTITQQPAATQACVGSTASLSIASSGGGNVSYLWSFNNVNINTATNPSAATATLVLSNVQAAAQGTYRCTVSHSCGGAVLSQPVQLTVGTGPTISQQPTPVTVCSGSPVTFTVGTTAANVTYQWRKGTTNLANGGTISGAATATLNISGVTESDAAGDYNCVVTNTCGSVTSGNAALTLTPGVTITAGPTDASVCQGENATFTVAASNTSGASFRWRRNGTLISLSVNSSAGTPTLVLEAVSSADAGSYDCIITGGCGGVTSGAAVLSVPACGGCSLADIAGGGDLGNLPDGTIDGTDFIAFVNSFGIGDAAVDPAADVAGGGENADQPDGTIDGTDFIAFINAFAVGC